MLSIEAIKQFIAYYKFQVKTSQAKNYENYLRHFFIFLHNPDIEKVHLGDVINYLQFSRDFGLDEVTIYARCLAFRAFFSFFRKQDFKVLDPDLIPAHKPQPKFVDFITEEEHQALMKTLGDHSDRTIRNRTVLGLLHDTGMRKGELMALDVDHIDTVKMEGLIRTEKSRGKIVFRPVFWTKQTNEDLKRWLDIRSLYSDLANFDDKAVFITLWAAKGGTRISDNAIEEFIRQASVLARLPRTIHAHLYRHAFGNKLAREGENNSVISGLMGHSDINSSQIYTALNDQQKRDVYEKHFRG